MGFDCYTTFTSPIRKYSDLLIHRIIKAHLNQQADIALSEELINQLQTNLMTGRNAVNMTEQWLLTQYLQNQEGQSFDGIITQANPSGFTVQLNDTGITGTVDLRKDKKKYSFDQTYLKHTCGKQSYQIGQPISVTVEQANPHSRQIRFALKTH